MNCSIYAVSVSTQMHSVLLPAEVLCLKSLVTPSSRFSLFFDTSEEEVALVGGGGGEPVVLLGGLFLTPLTPI